jgi:hypothetical protein
MYEKTYTPHEARLYDTIQKLESELTALRSQLSQAQDNYEKVWDAAEHKTMYEYSGFYFFKHQHEPPPPDKTTFINNLKKGKE